MHAYLFLGQDLASEINSFIKKEYPSAMAVNFEIKKITDVRELNNFTNLKNKKTVYQIPDFHLASIEAQNAFLKSLEEPSESTIFILTAENENSIIPTILSRCMIKRFSIKHQKENDNEFLNSDINEQFIKISKIKNREEAKIFLKDIIQNHKKLEVLTEAYQALESNANVQLQLTKMVLRLNS